MSVNAEMFDDVVNRAVEWWAQAITNTGIANMEYRPDGAPMFGLRKPEAKAPTSHQIYMFRVELEKQITRYLQNKPMKGAGRMGSVDEPVLDFHVRQAVIVAGLRDAVRMMDLSHVPVMKINLETGEVLVNVIYVGKWHNI